MGGGGAGLPPRHSRQSVRMVHLPPVANELQVFKMLPRAKPSAEGGGEEEEEEDEGIRYVDNVQVVGGVLGTVLKASGDFVGQPTMQWYWHRNPNPDPDPNLKESRRRSGTSPTRRRALEASGAPSPSLKPTQVSAAAPSRGTHVRGDYQWHLTQP